MSSNRYCEQLMPSGFEAILGRLANRDLILPFFEASMLSDKWPLSYQVRIDSSPYYGAGDGYFHPSTHPMMGERELYYLFHPDFKHKMHFEPNSMQRQMAFAMGSALHGVLQTQMTMCKLITEADVEVEYVNHEHHVRGRIDWMATHPNGSRLLVEMKTRGPWLFARQEAPEPSWVAQMQLGMDSQDVDLGVLLMVESGYPYRMTEFQVKRDPGLLHDIYTKFDRVRAAIAANELPRYCCAPTDKKIIDKCPARHSCHLAKDGLSYGS